MVPHPTGTVTFLFTDIQGSTKLWQSQPEEMRRSQARHNDILRAAFEANQGYVFEIVGDAFCAAFPSAECAVQAAVAAQLDLQSEAWGDAVIRVRMGIHTGKADLREDGLYSGYTTLSHVQRLMSVAHGGQCLLSSTTEPLTRGGLPAGAELRDLGEHRLKDVPRAERIFELLIPGLLADFPPLATLNTLRHNLPLQLTSFVGRKKELADVKRLLPHTHLLTLTGPGGTGKSRLAIQTSVTLLETFSHGAWLVELAPVSDPAQLAGAVLAALELPPEIHRPAIDMLCDYLRDKQFLLILDNCEHLIEACAALANRLLQAAQGLHILATSREALGIGGEVTYRVPSLRLPDPDHLPTPHSLNQYEAVRLFIERACAVLPDFKVTNQNAPAVAQICHRLDGIPLAIELAAAKVRALSVDQIAKRLDDRFRLLTGGSRAAMERHQTLRAALDWSHNLLPPAEQVLLRSVSVFSNGWTLEAAEAICARDGLEAGEVFGLLEQLVNKSLVSTETRKAEIRYGALETVRQYAGEKLTEAGESQLLRDRHLAYFLELAETAAPHLLRAEQIEWLERLDADHDNLRAALEWSLGRERPEAALRLCTALGVFWDMENCWREGARWLKRALEKPSDDLAAVESMARARALYQDAFVADLLDDLERMGASARESLTLCEHGGYPFDLAIAQFWMGKAYYREGDMGNARRLFEQALAGFRSGGNPYWQASGLIWVCATQSVAGELTSAEMLAQTLGPVRNSGERDLLGRVLCMAAGVAREYDQLPEARAYLEELHSISAELGGRSFWTTMGSIEEAMLAHIEGDYARARELYAWAIQRMDLVGERNYKAWTMNYLAALERDDAHLAEGQALLEEAAELHRAIGAPPAYYGVHLAALAEVLHERGQDGAARGHFREAILAATQTLEAPIQCQLLIPGLPFLAHLSPARAAQVLAAIQAFHVPGIRPIDPLGRRTFDNALARARLALGEAAFQAAWTQGEKLSMDAACDLALGALDDV